MKIIIIIAIELLKALAWLLSNQISLSEMVDILSSLPNTMFMACIH